METDITKLKLGPLEEDKPVKMTLDMPAVTHRNLVAYAEALAKQTGTTSPDPLRLIAPMVHTFMRSDWVLKKCPIN